VVSHEPRTHAPATQIGSVVVRCVEFERMIAFWSAVLGYVADRPAAGGFVILKDPSGRGPNLSLDRANDPRPRPRGRMHLDLYSDDQESEVARLEGLGARRYPWRYEPHADYVVLEDPDGNLFCVVAKGD
jgi:catechol 2,3-dioxygenase-like lactoylglutathione lyase family enzyme